MPTIKQRVCEPIARQFPTGIPEFLIGVYAARGISRAAELRHELSLLLDPALLGGIDRAAQLLGQSVIEQRHITVAGDYDCDGATGSAVGVRGLRMLGAQNVDFIVPNRFVHGYGLSPALVDAMPASTEVIVTVDSGVSSVEGVAHAKLKGKTVIITDHHLPGDYLPAADAIVNPNLKDDPFPSKMLAGVGVMFYVLVATRRYLRQLGYYADRPMPHLETLLDLVALGTVADLVPLDHNNRILVAQGLRRIRNGQACEGVKALVGNSRCNINTLVASDFAFSVAPKLNAAGRIENMSIGVQTLLCDNPQEARAMAETLDGINKERREMQATMVSQAEVLVETTLNDSSLGVVVFDTKWHAGIVGLVASKLKETLHRPVFAFAPAGEGSLEVRGSGRSIPGFHLRDALALIDARNPGLIPKFGGHAMAAGLSLLAERIPEFAKAFDAVAAELLTAEMLESVIYTDGPLPVGSLTLETAQQVREAGPWGQGFPEPVFEGDFDVVDFRVVGEKHVKYVLADTRNGSHVEGIHFFGYTHQDPPARVHLAFEMSVNEFRNEFSVQLLIRALQPID